MEQENITNNYEACENSEILWGEWCKIYDDITDIINARGYDNILTDCMGTLMRIRTEYGSGQDSLRSKVFSFSPILPSSDRDKFIRGKFEEISRACSGYEERFEPVS